ncbi:MAG TPA: hypothetical protein VJB14_18130 [Planctomycetota bacterium]|nr:hypothetical protein [Planctomycetota bacterium]
MIWLVIVLASVAAGWLFGHGDAAANARAAAHAAPADLLTVLLGATLGLFGRDRLRRRLTYASPTVGLLGKLVLFAGLSGAATFLFSPVAWPPTGLHASALVTASGLRAWLANLPMKL